MKKILFGFFVALIAVAALPLFAAFEAHVINVTARIENALAVTTDNIDFGTVFPQEHLERLLGIRLSGSFMTEDNADDVDYFIRQKPKCGITTEEGTILIGETTTGHVIPDGQGGYRIDCDPDPRELDQNDDPLPLGSSWGVLPSLCEYISKDGDSDQDPGDENDGTTPSFHVPFTVGTSSVNWLDTKGRLAKSEQDVLDTWVIDLAVPCFGGHCAQDWADFVHEHNPGANPDDYDQDIKNEHKVFGCDLWVEVSGVSRFSTSTLPI